jgi:hypothetical protein
MASGQKLLKVTRSQPLHSRSCAGDRSPRLGDSGICLNGADMLGFLEIWSKMLKHLAGDTRATAPTFQENMEARQATVRRFRCLSLSTGNFVEMPVAPTLIIASHIGQAVPGGVMTRRCFS